MMGSPSRWSKSENVAWALAWSTPVCQSRCTRSLGRRTVRDSSRVPPGLSQQQRRRHWNGPGQRHSDLAAEITASQGSAREEHELRSLAGHQHLLGAVFVNVHQDRAGQEPLPALDVGPPWTRSVRTEATSWQRSAWMLRGGSRCSRGGRTRHGVPVVAVQQLDVVLVRREGDLRLKQPARCANAERCMPVAVSPRPARTRTAGRRSSAYPKKSPTRGALTTPLPTSFRHQMSTSTAQLAAEIAAS